MSSLKKSMIAVMATLCMMFAVNVFAQSQNEDKKPDDVSSTQTTITDTTTTSMPKPVVIPSTGAAPVFPATSTGTAIGTPNEVGSPVNATPATPRRMVVMQNQGIQNQSTGQSIQLRQNSQIERNAQAAIQKAQEEMQKARTQFEKSLKELEKNNNPAAIHKAQEEMQKAMQMAQDEMLKAKTQLDRIGQEFHSIQVGPGGAQIDQFGSGGGFGGGMGGFGGSSGGFGRTGFSGGRGNVILDNRTGQMIVSGPDSIASVSDPEAKELRDKEQECTDKIGKIIDHYNSTPATPPGDRAAIKIELEKAVGEQFGIRQEYRELQIKQLEKELTRVRETIQKRNEIREQIIKRHIAQLLHEQEDMDF